MSATENRSGTMSSGASYWFQFFLDAGIPPADAGTYAVAFTENRIQQSMLCDLSKEYLSDMGITVMGDMIAILKHAKFVHSKKAREMALKCSGLPASSTDSKTSSVSNAASATKVAANQTKPATVATPSKTNEARATSRFDVLPAVKESSSTVNATQRSAAQKPAQSGDRNDVRQGQQTARELQSASSKSSSNGSSAVRTKPVGSSEVATSRSSQNVTQQNDTVSKSSKVATGKTDQAGSKVSHQNEPVRVSKGVFERLGKEADEDSDSSSTSSSSSSCSREVITDNRVQRARDQPAKAGLTEASQRPIVKATSSKPSTVTEVKEVQPASIFSRLGDRVSTSVKTSCVPVGDKTLTAIKRPYVSQISSDDAATSAKKVKQVTIVPPSKTVRIAPLKITLPVTPKSTPSSSYGQNSEGIFGSGSGAKSLENKSARLRLGAKTSGELEGGRRVREEGQRPAQKAVVSSTTQDQPRKHANISERVGRASIIPISFSDPAEQKKVSAAVGSVFSRLGKAVSN